MQLTDVEKQRTGLLQFLIVLIMIFLALIMIISYNKGLGYSIPSLTLLALASCLYAMAKERNLKGMESTLRRNLAEKKLKVFHLDRKLVEEQQELEEEKGRSSELGLRLKEITGLYRAISTVNAVSDPEKTYDTVLLAALALVAGDRGSIMLLNENRDLLFIASSHGLDESVIKQTAQRLGEGIAGRVAQTGEPVLVSGNAREDERFSNLTSRTENVQFSMSIPLILREEITGVMNLGTTAQDTEQMFSEYHLRIATIFAQHASVAILNAQLVQALRRLRGKEAKRDTISNTQVDL